jgi:APA family basic amino acid/polyamine antiporter
MTLGALVSVSGSNESGMLGTGRLSYAMSIDGLFPRIFSSLHQKYGTPYIGLAVQGLVAFLISLYSPITSLISFAVFNLAFAFLLTCFSLVILTRDTEKQLIGQKILPWVGIMICLYLLYSTSLFDKVVGVFIILAGVPFTYFSRQNRIFTTRRICLSRKRQSFSVQWQRENGSWGILCCCSTADIRERCRDWD